MKIFFMSPPAYSFQLNFKNAYEKYIELEGKS